jgi:16S rRNA (cytosine967-C5)-methyltransferase
VSVAGAALRAQAARVLVAVLVDGRSLKAVLAETLPRIADVRDRALLEAICFSVLRHRRRYEFAIAQWLAKPLPARDSAVQMLLLSGLAQLDDMRLPAHAAVAATAEAARLLDRAPLVGLVNALLRRATREPMPESESDAVRHSHSDWLVERLREDWVGDAGAIQMANNQAGPVWLRVNATLATRDDYAARLAAAGFGAILAEFPAQAIRLDAPGPPQSLPGWREGEVTVQDGAAQLAVEALGLRATDRVLDACTAPGGKAAQIAESVGAQGSLLALDADAARLARVRETLARLRLESPRIELRAADAADVPAWWDGVAFDAILLDAPCSATGIIRRQPDIKWHRRAEDIPVLVAQQARLLDALWATLAAGGRLLYATCSVLKDENERQIEAFLARTPDAAPQPLDARFGRASGAGRQRLPGEDGMDGFFYALIAKCRS